MGTSKMRRIRVQPCKSTQTNHYCGPKRTLARRLGFLLTSKVTSTYNSTPPPKFPAQARNSLNIPSTRRDWNWKQFYCHMPSKTRFYKCTVYSIYLGVPQPTRAARVTHPLEPAIRANHHLEPPARANPRSSQAPARANPHLEPATGSNQPTSRASHPLEPPNSPS
jgi:hypothetical protein